MSDQVGPPRTLRRARSEDVSDDEDESATTPADDDGDTEASSGGGNGLSALPSGWTEGQKVMDSTAPYAQPFQPEQAITIIKFLEDKPYANYRRHWIDRMTPQGPKKRPYTCLESVGKECPLCGIGDRPQAVSAFNVAVVGDDGATLLKSWDVGARIFNVLKAYNNDAKVGPLTKRFYAVNKTGGGKGQGGNVQTNISPVSATALREDYDIDPPSQEALDKLKLYDSSIVEIPKRSDLDQIAEEIANYE